MNGPSTLPRLCAALSIACVLGACVKRLPPAPTPEPVVPAIPAAKGQLVVDVVEGPTPVQRVGMEARPQDNGRGRVSYQFVETPQLLCRSPCAADAAGNILLGFPVIGNNELEVELVHVGPDPSVYRRSLSIYEDRSGGLRVFGIVATAVGGGSLAAGATFLPLGLSRDNDAMTTAGIITLGAGVALLAFGIWAIRKDAPTFRPGSSNHFPLAAP
ncbi:MAG TPA: hypothetical protein VIU61_17640 [Kofleriaceae bacterium]